jgi:spermidine synthase
MPALIYQLVWQRILALHSGVGIYSVAMIVAAYMAGLGIGSYAGGRLSRRLSEGAALFAFAGLELAIGLFAALSCPLYYDLLYLKGAWLYDATWRAGVCHFLALLPPTCLMGMSLPLLVRAMVRSVPTASRTIGYLYGVNVLGAAIGAFIAPWFLIRYLGLAGAILVGVGGNVAVGIGALVLGLCSAGPVENHDQEDPPQPIEPSHVAAVRWPFGFWVVLYTLSGFYAIALEIVWFRLVDVAIKSTAFTFGTVLAVYLLGLAIGSLAGAHWGARIKRPLNVFLVCQCLLLLYAGFAVVLLADLPTATWGYGWFFTYWGRTEVFSAGRGWPRAEALLYGTVPMFLYGVPTVLMGLSFAALQRAVHDERRTSGYKVGVLQSANIAGCVAGSLLVGLLLLSIWGTAGTLRGLVICGSLFAVLGCYCCGLRSAFVPLGLAFVLLASVLPDQEALWLRLHGREHGPALFEEDATSVVGITPHPAKRNNWLVSLNGKSQSWLPFGGVHTLLGALPATLHPAPKRIAIIGLGSGDTAWAAACRPETEHVTVFEICTPEIRSLRRLDASMPVPHLGGFLLDPRIEFKVADGRNALASGRETYDLIEADPPHPDFAYSGNVYSMEYFRLCAAKLNRGGLICHWAPTNRIRASLQQALPHVLEVGTWGMLIGSNQPIQVDAVAWQARLRSSAVADYLSPEIVENCAKSLGTIKLLASQEHLPNQINQDLFPRDEYRSPW